jgi:chemotaxis protein methyltransferase CheR
MNVEDFTLLAKMVKDRSGLTLTRDKAYLVESRLLPVARKWNLKTLDELAVRLRAKQEQPLIRDIVEAMTTNESFFFRDIKPFDQFRQVVLPYLLQTRAATKTIKIWSAACSSGQEPYTVAMILREERHRLNGWHVDILATDLSTEILSKAQAGLYSQFEVQRGLPIQMLVKYFKQTGDRWQIDPGLREQIRYRPFNLLDEMTGLGVFDVVFCRNVLIYLDQPTKQSVLERIAKQLTPDGFLYLGGAETVVGITDKFQPMANHRGLYHQAIAGAARVAGL